MKNYKLLETEYNGITFKSRLKARWAVYFDNVGIKYMYEPKNYSLREEITYLPDFYFPDFVCFAEVKAGYMDGGEIDKAVKLVEDTKFPLVSLKGDPGLTHYEMMMPTEVDGQDQFDVVDVNLVQDPNRKKGKFMTGFYLKGEDDYKKHGLVKAIQAVKAANNL